MGYYDRSQLNPHSSVAFIKKENEFVHPWSINAIGKYYGRAKLKDVIPLHDYLNLPAFLVDDLVLAISEGEAQRSKADADATPPEAGLSKEEKEILELARKAGMGKL